ncbi:MAG: OmpA family protein [Thiohalocapsa sp.]
MKRALVLFCSLLALAACVPPPSPPPGPPPGRFAAPSGTRIFTVYFGWNRARVGRAGMAVLQQAAAAYRAGGVVTVQVTGFTDTSGSSAYNLSLSARRAQNVGHILTSLGVPWTAMQIAAAGETNLAVPIPEGVREPRNRRVTVVE